MKLIKIKSAYYECEYKMYRNRPTRLAKDADLLASNKPSLKKSWNIFKSISKRWVSCPCVKHRRRVQALPLCNIGIFGFANGQCDNQVAASRKLVMGRT